MIIFFRSKRHLQILCFCGYIGNHYFPKPLKPEEEKEMLRRRQRGDEEARNILIEHNLRLVAHVCKKYEQSGLDKEDLISIGTIGLIKAIDSFSPDRNVRLATYAARCIDNEVLMVMRSGKNLRQEISLYEPLGQDKEGNEVSLIDILCTQQNSLVEDLEKKHEVEELSRKMQGLDEREQTVLRLRYGLNGGKKYTQKLVAQKLNISRSYVSRIEKKALKKLSKEMNLE